MTRLYIISRLARQNYWINVDAQYSYKTYIKRNNRNKQYLPVYLILYSNFEFMPIFFFFFFKKLTKIHRVLQFDESPCLAKYINFNTEKRKEAKNAFENDYFKLMNNAVFGKKL